MVVRSTLSPRRSRTALVRRFWNSSSSRKAYGRAVTISWARTDASVVSQQWTRTSPASIRSSSWRSPSTSRASCRVSSIVWRTSRWSGISIGPDGVVLAGRGLGEHRGQQVVGLHALDRRRVAPAAAEPQHHQRPVEVPAPAGLEHRRVQDGVLEGVGDGPARHVAGHLVEGEAVVGAERQHHGVVGGGRLQLEVEGPAELLAQGQAEAPVDPAPVRRVDDQLHPARCRRRSARGPGTPGSAWPRERPARRPGSRRSWSPPRRRSRRCRSATAGPRPGRRRPGTRRRGGAAPTPPRTARPSGPAPPPARTARSAACRRRRGPAPRPARPGGSARSGCRAGRCRPPSTRPPSPR